MEHVDYPHNPGQLHDCEACEFECYCAEDYTCIVCAFFDGDLDEC